MGDIGERVARLRGEPPAALFGWDLWRDIDWFGTLVIAAAEWLEPYRVKPRRFRFVAMG